MEEEHAEPTEIAPIEGPLPGTILLGKYRVDWMLGIGGYGYVVRAHHLELGEAVAIKILRDDREIDQQNLGRFFREAQAIVRLKSEHVANVHDVGKLPSGAPYLVMELLEGEDLGKTLETRGPLDVTTACDYMLQACEALAEAHALGIIHRDVKPTNLFLTQRPDGRAIVKVLDFGISKTRRENEVSMRLTQTQSVLGTPAYMSPEQMRSARSVDARTDIWALGAVLYELVEGELPFDAENFAELCVVVATEQPRPMQRAPELRGVIESCLAKRVEDRLSTIADVVTAIAPFSTPDTAREYVSRVHRLLDRPVPTGSIASAASGTAIEVAHGSMRAPKFVTPRSDAITIQDPRPRRRALWIALALLVVAGAAATAAIVLQPTPPVADPVVASPPPMEVHPPPRIAPSEANPNPVKPTAAPVDDKLAVKPVVKPKTPTLIKKPTERGSAGSGSATPAKKKCDAERAMYGC